MVKWIRNDPEQSETHLLRVYLSETFRRLAIPFTAPKPGDAGYDLYAVKAYQIEPGARALISTGIHVEIPAGYVGLIKDRSSMANSGLHTLGGVIDSGYRGELKILMLNTNPTSYSITVGQKITQMVVVPCYTEAVEVVPQLEALTATQRGAGGFGSTGQ